MLLSDALWLVLAYFTGSIPTAYLAAKQVRGIDIREHGSGNVGATNVFRTVGKGWGSAVLIIDIFKGWLASFVLAHLSHAFPELSRPLVQIFFGAAAVAGHTWTPWLGFKGGKGIAASAGALLGVFPQAALIAFAIWGAVFRASGYVSLASIIAVGSFPLLLILFYRTIDSFPTILIASLMLAAGLIYNHKANIQRLRRGEEPRVNF